MSTYDPAKHHRRSIRLQGHDYAAGGTYFVTICAKGRKPLFGAMQNGQPVLSEGGKMAEKCWHAIPEHFPNVEAGAFVAMPDHVHGIIRVHAGAKNLSPIPPAQPTPGERPRGTSQTLGSVVRGFKVGVTKWFRQNTEVQEVWHRNYYEMIVRSAEAEEKIAHYIQMNPWRCVQQFANGLRGMGNPALWQVPKLGVLCSRNATRPKSIPAASAYFSGFHSPMEKQIFERLLEAKRPLIWCPAWGLDRAASDPAVRQALEENRMLVLEMKNAEGDLAAAEARNRFVIENADTLWTPHVNPGGMLDRLLNKERTANER